MGPAMVTARLGDIEELANATDPCAPLLNGRRAARSLSALIDLPAGRKIQSARIARVYPAKPNGFGIQFDVSLTGPRGQSAAGSIYLSGGIDGRRSNRLRVAPNEALPLRGLRAPMSADDRVVHTADRDSKLPAIRHVTCGPEVGRRLSEAAAARLKRDVRSWRCRLGNYRPRRRCTLLFTSRARGNDAFVVVKLFRESEARRRATVARRMASALRRVAGGEIRIPRVLAVWNDWDAVVFEGIHTTDGHRFDGIGVIAEAAGRVLAAVHGCNVPGLGTFTPRDEIRATGRWIDLTRRLGRSDATVDRVGDWLARVGEGLGPGWRATIHRDCYSSQLIRAAEAWGLVDLDTAVRGDREQDLGNFIGHLIWDVTSARQSSARWKDAAQRFVDSYVEARGRFSRASTRAIHTRRLQFYVVSSVLRVGLIHGLRTGHGAAARRMTLLARELASSRRGLSFVSGRRLQL